MARSFKLTAAVHVAIVGVALALTVATAAAAKVVGRDGDVSASSSVWVDGASKKFTPTASLSVTYSVEQVYRERAGYDDNGDTVYAPDVTRGVVGTGTVSVECGNYVDTIIGPWWQDRVTRKRLVSTGTTKFAMPRTRPGERCKVRWELQASDYSGSGDVVSTTGLVTITTAGSKRP